MKIAKNNQKSNLFSSKGRRLLIAYVPLEASIFTIRRSNIMCPNFDTYNNKCGRLPDLGWNVHYALMLSIGSFEKWCKGHEYHECGIYFNN